MTERLDGPPAPFPTDPSGVDPDSIDWTRPPQYVGGVLNLALPGEDLATLTPAVLERRTQAYLRQVRPSPAELAARAAAAAERFADSLGTVAEVFGLWTGPDGAAEGGGPLGPDAGGGTAIGAEASSEDPG